SSFQECKAIEERQLAACGPSDYKCQCDAQRLIQQCYNLCPEYASDAQIHSGTVESICAAVPTPSVALTPISSVAPSSLASATLVAPSISAASNAPAASQSAHGSGSSINHPAGQIAAVLISFVVFGIYTQF
ncbi:hypothetical protein K501DRAFT_175905, partial [Backusella circina FSU 941]